MLNMINDLYQLVLLFLNINLLIYSPFDLNNKSYLKSLKSLLIGTFFIFLLGVGYLGSIIGIEKAISAGFYPFILSEIFKILLAVALIPNITKYLNK